MVLRTDERSKVRAGEGLLAVMSHRIRDGNCMSFKKFQNENNNIVRPSQGGAGGEGEVAF